MKRYSPVVMRMYKNVGMYVEKVRMAESTDGEWVRWEDVKEIIEEYQKIINEEQNDINYL